MKKKLSTDHLKIIYSALAAHQRTCMDKVLESKIKRSTAFEKVILEEKKVKQDRVMTLIEELKEVLDRSFLTTKERESSLVEGIGETLESVFTPEVEASTTLDTALDSLESKMDSINDRLKPLDSIQNRLTSLENPEKKGWF
jgi:hypothetical protein